MERKKRTANDPKHTASSVKHGGGGVMAWWRWCHGMVEVVSWHGGGGVMAWWRWCHGMGMHDCLWDNSTDDFMYDDSSRIHFEGYKTILPCLRHFHRLLPDPIIAVFGVTSENLLLTQGQSDALAFSSLLARRLILLQWRSNKPPTHVKWEESGIFKVRETQILHARLH